MNSLRRAGLLVEVGALSIMTTHLRADDKSSKPDQDPRAAFGNPICASQCAADVIADGFVNIDDLVAVITGWGFCVTCPPTICSGDANHDCVINIDDLVTVITGWGPCPAPVNDNCATPKIMNLGNDYTFCTAYATTDGPAEPGCQFCCNDQQIHKDIWYTFSTSQFGGNYWLYLDTCGADFDTKIAVYRASGISGCSCPVTPGQLIACNDDANLTGCSLQSRIEVPLAALSCYKVRVGGYNGQSGSGVLRARGFFIGDECFNATDMGTVTSTTPLSVLIGNNGPSSQYSPGFGVPQAPCTTFPDGNDVWLKFQIGCGGTLIGSVNTCDPATDFDTILTVYRGTCDGLVLVGCNDDYTGNNACLLNGLFRKSLVSLPSAASPGYYYVRVSGYNNAWGTCRVNVGISCIN